MFISCENNEKSNKEISYEIEKYFEKVRDIRLDTSKYLSIRYLEVNKQGDFLVTNDSRSDVILYDSLGNFKRDLSASADSTFPGINWSPSRAYLTKDDKIFVSNNAPWGLFFDSQGSFMEPTPKEYIAGSDLAFDSVGNIFSFNSNHNGIYISKHSITDYRDRLKFGHYPKEFKNVIDKAIIGNNMLVLGESLFVKNIAEPKIYKYNLDGKLIDSFTQIPSYYKEPKEDVRLQPFDFLRRDLFSFAKKYTANYSIHSLNKQIILVQYLNFGYEYGIQLLTPDGNYLLDKDLVINQKVLFAQNGFIYTVNNKSKYENDRLLQPIISIYKFKDLN